MKTTNLSLPRARWADLPPPIAAAICIFLLLLLGLIVGRVRSLPADAPVAPAIPTPGLIILIATARPTPLAPTPDMAMRDEIDQLRARIAELEQQAAAPAPAPIIIEQPIYVSAPAAAPVEAVPTVAPQYQVTNDPPISERQRNIQQRLVDPQVAQQWAAEQWRQEHCVGEVCR